VHSERQNHQAPRVSPEHAAPGPSLPIPFASPSVMQSMFSRQQAVAFLRFRQVLDPENRFWAGGGTHYFSKQAKREASRADDPDQLEEDYLLVRIKATADAMRYEEDMRRTTITTALIFGFIVLALSNLVSWYCSRRSEQQRGRSRRRRDSSDESSASGSDGSDGSSSEYDSESDRSSTRSSDCNDRSSSEDSQVKYRSRSHSRRRRA